MYSIVVLGVISEMQRKNPDKRGDVKAETKVGNRMSFIMWG